MLVGGAAHGRGLDNDVVNDTSRYQKVGDQDHE